MKRNSILLLVLWILSLAGISFIGGQIAYGLFFLFTLMPVFSLLYCLLVIVLFKIYQSVEGRNLTAEQPAVYSFILQNESFLLFAGIRVRFYSSFSTISGLSDQTEYELLPHHGIRRTTDIVCHYRGEYAIGIKTIEVTDFFRLFTIAFHNREPKTVIVKPNIVFLNGLHSFELSLASMNDSRLNPTDPDLTMHEYVPGDDPRLINWKATGAAGKLLVREQIGQQQTGVGILLDPMRCGTTPEEYLPPENKMLETCIALTLFLSQKGIPVDTYCYDRSPEQIHVSRTAGFAQFYERLSAFRFSRDRSNPSLYEQARSTPGLFYHNLLVLILQEWNAAASEFIHTLIRNQITVIVYVISDQKQSFENRLPRTVILQIPTDADLTEVL